MNDEQHLTYELGMTNVPSDATRGDNGLEESIGLTYADGEHRVIQKPVEFMTDAIASWKLNVQDTIPTIVYIHKMQARTNYIAVTDEDATTHKRKLVWGWKDTQTGYWDYSLTYYILLEDITDIKGIHVESVGNTLIVSVAEKIYYFLWSSDSTKYISLGSKLPEVELQFRMKDTGSKRRNSGEHSNFITWGGTLGDTPFVSAGENQQKYDDLVKGLYDKNINEHYEHGEFVKPFVLRYALELYDGSYVHASVPIMMFPSVKEHCIAEYSATGALNYVRIWTEGCILQYKRTDSENLTLWKDIIKKIAVFVSRGVDVYDLTGEQTPTQYSTAGDGDVWRDGVYSGGVNSCIYRQKKYADSGIKSISGGTMIQGPFNAFNKRSELEIKNDLTRTSVFYKLFSMNTSTTSLWSDTSWRIDKNILKNLESQERLPDDYFSHCELGAGNINTYNNRSILSNVLRGFYEGAGHFLYDEENANSDYLIVVRIDTPSEQKYVTRYITTPEIIGGWYFYYPDPRAKWVWIYKKDGNEYKQVMYELLEESNSLNGAFYFKNLPNNASAHTTPGTVYSAHSAPTPERLYNQIWVSEVNNPFVFRAEGNVTVGNGEIIGVSSLTQALSQGQFGQYPLIVFSTDGIWAASTGSTGLFTAVHPMSREVALKDNPCITQTDGAIFFATKKGLMLIVGSDVRCVSEQLSGKSDAPFAEFLQEAVIAYDYRDGLLWIFKDNSENAWIYNIKSGTFGRYALTATTPASPITVVNNYPDYLIQGIKVGTDPQDTVYSLMERVDINDDNSTYAASMKTRAMKLGGGMTLKSIMRMKNIFDINGQDGSLSVQIWAKNNLNDAWVQLTHLRGVPHKYYQLRYTFTNLLAKDRFAGTVLITQERRTNKLR